MSSSFGSAFAGDQNEALVNAFEVWLMRTMTTNADAPVSTPSITSQCAGSSCWLDATERIYCLNQLATFCSIFCSNEIDKQLSRVHLDREKREQPKTTKSRHDRNHRASVLSTSVVTPAVPEKKNSGKRKNCKSPHATTPLILAITPEAATYVFESAHATASDSATVSAAQASMHRHFASPSSLAYTEPRPASTFEPFETSNMMSANIAEVNPMFVTPGSTCQAPSTPSLFAATSPVVEVRDQSPPSPTVSMEEESDDDLSIEVGLDHRKKLTDLFGKYNPDKLDSVNTLLHKYRGREDALYAKIEKKYKHRSASPMIGTEHKNGTLSNPANVAGIAASTQHGASPPRQKTEGATSEDKCCHKQKLISLFEMHNPDKLGSVDMLLMKYKGREEVLYQKIANKYTVTTRSSQVALAD